jgi:hypothetical protein
VPTIRLRALKMVGTARKRAFAHPTELRRTGTRPRLRRYLRSVAYQEEAVMPVLVMWAIPAVVVIGGVGYFLVHMH